MISLHQDYTQQVERLKDGKKLLEIINDFAATIEADENYEPTEQSILELLQSHDLSLSKYLWVSITMLLALLDELAAIDNSSAMTINEDMIESLDADIEELINQLNKSVKKI